MKTNVYGGGSLDRAALRRGDSEWLAERLGAASTRMVPVWQSRHLVLRSEGDVAALFPHYDAGTDWPHAGESVFFLGLLEDTAYFAIDLSHLHDPMAVPALAGQGEFVELREVGPLLPRDDAALLAYARAMVHWHQTHRYCGRCGAPTTSRHGGHVRQCTAADCLTDHFPRTDPAIIVLVSAQDHCILGRQARWRPGMFSTLAGFVEPGETLEEAVAREVMEEVGVPLYSIRYHSSQPWPFPGSLMVGFEAETDALIPLSIDRNELETAHWFSRNDIARFAETGRSLPNRDSIARRLIEDWLSRGK
jgi:NAD+ diphosphatase